MIFIAQKTKNGTKVGIKEIAKGIDSPEFFIAKILQNLSRRGLLQSAKGPTGGFFVDETQNCTLADIIRAIDGDKIFSGCGLGLDECSEDHPCPIHHEFKIIRKQINTMLQKAKIEDFQEILDNKLAFLKR